MGLISSTIPNLVNGVSQQPFALRLASQADEQINALSSVVEGLRKRPPTRHRAKIMSTPLTNAATHLINRDATERYEVVATNGDLRVFRLDGTEVAVAFPNGKGYLSAANPAAAIGMVTVADFTFVVNKTVTVQANQADLVPARPFEALVWVRQGAYQTKYTLTVDGVTVTHQTPPPLDGNSGNAIQTDFVANALVGLLSNAGINTSNGYLVTFVGATPSSTIHIQRTDRDFTISVQDSLSDTALRLVKSTATRFSELPAKARDGFRARIAGSTETPFDDYYVQYKTETDSPNGGVWEEGAKAGEVRSFLASTMPHVLVRESGGTFTFRQATWPERKVGDLDSVPMPSFVGRKLNDIFFHRNRLGFLSDENIVFSRAGEFFHFFRTSAIQVLDTDPIDVAGSHVKVSILQHAVPFNESLLLFSEQTQFMLGRADVLTPRTISLNQTTEFQCSLDAKPVGAGNNVFFATNRDGFSAIREYYVDGESETNDAADVTAHCPTYVPAEITKLAASSNEDALVALSKRAPNALFVYRYYWSGNEKLQSSWSRWELGPECSILSVDWIESDLWLLVSRPDGVFLESLSFAPGSVDLPSPLTVHLDRRLSQAQVTIEPAPGGSGSRLTLPYRVAPGTLSEYRLVAWHGGTLKPGKEIAFTEVPNGSGNTIIQTPVPVTHFFFGRSYRMLYRFSTLTLKEAAQGGGMQPVGAGRIQLRSMTVTYANTGYFRAEVTPQNRETYKTVFSGRVIGSGNNVIGDIATETGRFRFGVMAQNTGVQIELINDSFLPSAFMSAEWEAFFHIRSRRV